MASNSYSSPTRQLIIGPQMIIPTANCGQQTSVVHPPVTAFVLRLPDHQKELHRFFWDLFDDQSYTDVTITLDDGQYIKAHKLILCAFSVYFRQVLTRIANPCQQTIIVVKDMNYEDVRCLIEFMYRGCVTVPDRRLQQLLKCAKELKIRGLYEMNEEMVTENTSTNKYCNKNVSNQTKTKTIETNSPTICDMKNKEYLCFDRKLDQKMPNFGPMIADRNANNYINSQEFVNNWLNKKSFAIPSPPKFSAPVLPQKSPNALDLSKRMSINNNNNSEQCLPISTIKSSPSVFHPGFTSHPSLFRSTSVDECQLNKNKFLINGINGKPKRGPSSLDGHLDSNNNDLEPDDNRKEKKRNLNIFHAAKYRNRKKQQLETLFNEETELQKKNCLAKVEIEKLESTILSLIWQHTKKQFQSQTVFSCPVCGNVQNEVPKLRSHINMLHNDTEALMKFLMLQRSPSFTTTAINSNINNNSTNPVVVQNNSTVSMPIIVQNTQKTIN